MEKKELTRRYALFTLALFVSSLGVSCITRATLGTSPISSIPFVLSKHTWLSMGTFTFLLNVLLMVIQFALLGKSCTRKQATEIMLQLPVSVLFGVFIDLTMALLALYVPSNYLFCLLELLVGCVILALGVVGEVIANVVMLSGELTVQIASKKFHKEFGMVKMVFDVSLVLMACVLSMALCYHDGQGLVIDGVREGTIVGALLVGPIVRFFRPRFQFLDHWLVGAAMASTTSQVEAFNVKDGSSSTSHLPLVITIAREFGSGGHELGQRLAQQLGIAFYDKELISLAATEGGFTENFVRDNEQNVSNSLLFELIMQDYEAPIDKSLSSADALFVAQSKVIRRIAQSESCVIVGRCANYILNNRPHTFNVFIYSDGAHQVERAINVYHLDPAKAATEVEHINKARANHYLHYTGHHWHDARNYHMVLNADSLGQDETCRIIQQVVEKM